MQKNFWGKTWMTWFERDGSGWQPIAKYCWFAPRGRHVPSESEVENATDETLGTLYFLDGVIARTALFNARNPPREFVCWECVQRTANGVPMAWTLRQQSLRNRPSGRREAPRARAQWNDCTNDALERYYFTSIEDAEAGMRYFYASRREALDREYGPLFQRWNGYTQRADSIGTGERAEHFNALADEAEARLRALTDERRVLDQRLDS